ncbi:MAG: T9SS type A sorting domain-containing protein [Bacteroidia bacterium]|nr:T9SS type A sorting domain-containing protein [Bacteroidia bacterium]
MLEFTSGSPGFALNETGSDLVITGDGTAAPYSSVSYLLHDKDLGSQIFVNMAPGDDRLYLRMKTASGTVPVRVDLIDTADYHTTQASLTKVISDEYGIYEYNFSGAYTDAGYGGTSCATGPCPVDRGAIKQVLIYIDPIQGGFNGEVSIDFLSIGKPLGEDAGPKGVINYFDEIADNTNLFVNPPAGFTSTTANGEWTITGDGTAGAYSAFNYDTHNPTGEAILVDAVGSNDKLYVRAKSSTAGTNLRIDLKDKDGYVTNLNPPSATLTTDYQIYEYDYAGAYQDGAYGGSPCATQGCPVDGERISAIQFFVDPVSGGFSGDVTIDWISFGVNTVGIDQDEFVSQMRLFPNPAETIIHLEYSLSATAKVELAVFNLVGQQVLADDLGMKTLGQQAHTFDTALLPPGMYVLQVRTDGQQAGSMRFIKR